MPQHPSKITKNRVSKILTPKKKKKFSSAKSNRLAKALRNA